MNSFCLFLFFLFTYHATAQTVQSIQELAERSAQNQQYDKAASLYRKIAALESQASDQEEALYQAARFYALSGQNESAIQNLEQAVRIGFTDSRRLRKDPAFEPLHRLARWKACLRQVRLEEKRIQGPGRVRLITADIDHFWEAYDAVQQQPDRAKEWYQSLYFGRASAGLANYFKLRIGSLQAFLKNQEAKPAFYKAIRPVTARLSIVKKDIRRVLRRLDRLYPEAEFADIYFLIGRWSAAGTVSDSGILVGLDQYVRTAGIPLHELDEWEKRNFHRLEELPALVAHELVHVQQRAMARDTTLLSSALREGMADFIAELLAGQTTNETLHQFVAERGLEKQIWQEFSKVMHLRRSHEWMGNRATETTGRPADLGYYVGYKICEAYFRKASDKGRAVRKMLHLQDYEAFLTASGYGG